MKTLHINEDTYQLPSSWDELTLDQLYFIVNLTINECSIEDFKINVFLKVLNAHIGRHFHSDGKRIRLIIKKKTYLILPGEMAPVIESMNFLIDEHSQGDIYRVRPALVRNPLKKLKVNGLSLTGPEDALSNITYEQFIMLQTYHDRMRLAPESIYNLIAVLYHPTNSYNLENIDKQALELKSMRHEDKILIFWFYISCLEFLADKFPRVFSGGDTSTLVSQLSVFESQMIVVNSLAGGDMTKKPAIREGLLYDALFSIEENIRQQEDREKV